MVVRFRNLPSAAGQCTMCQASRWVIWLACRFPVPLGVEWGWHLVVHSFPTNSEPKPNKISCALVCYYRMTKWCSYSMQLGPRSETIFLSTSTVLPTNWTAIRQSVPSVDIVHVPTVDFTNDSFSAFPCSSQKLPSACRLCLTIAHYCFNFSYLNVGALWHSFMILTVLEQLIPLVHRLSNKHGEEMKLSIKSLWHIPSTLLVRLLNVVCVTVIITCVAFCLSFPK